MKKNYIGLATTLHDSALAVVNHDGELVFAEATERYMQNKRAMNISPDVFLRISEIVNQYCDPEADFVVAHTWSENTENVMKHSDAGLDYTIEAEKQIQELFGEVPFSMKRYFATNKFILYSQINSIQQAAKTLEHELAISERWSKRGYTVKRYEHHLTHAAAACYTSSFKDAACVVLDGFGETGAYSCYSYKDGTIKEVEGMENKGIGSLGVYYNFVCDICGFESLTGEEWKVMGLAAYGKFDEEIYGIFKKIIKINGLHIEMCESNKLLQIMQKIYSRRRKKGAPLIDYADIAYTGQYLYNELLFEYLNNVYKLGISDNLVLSGGCGLNSSANGKIIENTPFKSVHIYCAPGDDGNAVGAALMAYYEDHLDKKPQGILQHPYLGSKISQHSLANFMKFSGLKSIETHPDNICQKAAQLIADGKIIGWIQGRAEFGPRALGNRSILADARNPKIKDEINSRVKFREEFRPLAPSILSEFGPDYFENYQDSPYMERTLYFKKEMVRKVPGVVHEDGTGRLQSVKKHWNERYYKLIWEFYQITGVPLVLNTSFNVMGKPIVHSLEDAVAVFFTCGLDALVIGDILVLK
jgi:carbamoyltransferase